jgi:serine/threonine protein kinase
VPGLDKVGYELLDVRFRAIFLVLEDVINGLYYSKSMLQYDPNKRITAHKAMKHPFFDGLPQRIAKEKSEKKK